MDMPERYLDPTPLGAGAMGAVYRVFDAQRQMPVALKVAHGGKDSDTALQLRHEFWTMATFRHQNLVESFDFMTLPDGRAAFTMALLADPNQHPSADAPAAVDEAAVRQWLPGILAALAFLHRAGFRHGDVKPENIGQALDGTFKLLDFGLLTPLGPQAGVGQAASGTPLYMAPEVWAGRPVDGRADLYALGVTLFHLLTGHPPFSDGEGVLALGLAHLNQAAPRLREERPDVSLALSDAVERLLAKNPDDRPADAGAVMVALGLPAAALPEGGLRSGPIVGMHEARAALETEPEVVIVGPAGAGKTRLFAEASAAAQLAGKRVFVIAPASSEAPPYAAIADMLTGLVAAATPDLATRLGPIIARVAPGVGLPPAPGLDGLAERLRLQAAVAELAKGGAAAGAVFIDGGDRLDTPSRELLNHLKQALAGLGWTWHESQREAPAGAPGAPVRFLPALQADEVATLVRHMLGGEAPESLLPALANLGQGNPGRIVALLNTWVRRGALRRVLGQWTVANGVRLEAVELAIANEALPPEIVALASDQQVLALAMVRLASYAQGNLSWPFLAEVLACSDADMFAAARALEVAGQASQGLDGLSILPAAWPLASHLSPEAASPFHQRAAQALAAQVASPASISTSPTTLPSPDAVAQSVSTPLGLLFAIAEHALSSRDPLAAIPWVIAATSRALALHAIGASEGLLHRALEVAEAGDQRLALGLLSASIARYQGRIDDALAQSEALEPNFDVLPPAERARQLTTLGLLLQQKGRYPEAEARYETALGLAQATGEPREAARAAFVAARVAFFTGQTDALDAKLTRARIQAEMPGAEALLAPILSFSGYWLASHEPERLSEAAALIQRAIAAATAIGDVHAEHEARNNEGNMWLTAGRYTEAIAAFDCCHDLATQMDTPNEAIFATLNGGIARLELGLAADACSRFEHGLAMARAQGRAFPEAAALGYLGLGQALLGERREADNLDEAVAIATRIGNAYARYVTHALRAEALLATARHAEALADVAAARTAMPQATDQASRLKRVETALRVVAGESAAWADLQPQIEALSEVWQGYYRRCLRPSDPIETAASADNVPLERLRLLADLVAAAAVQPDLEGVLLQSLRALVELTGMERGFLLLYEDMAVVRQVQVGATTQDSLAYSEGLAREVAWKAETVVVSDTYEQTAIGSRASVQALALRSAIGVPLLAPTAEGLDEIVGVMLADSQHLAPTLGPTVQGTAQALARLVAGLVTTARRQERLANGYHEGAFLLQVAKRLLATPDVEQRIQVLVTEAIALCGAERGLVLEGPDLAVRGAWKADGSPSISGEVSHSIASWARDNQEPLQLLDAQSDAGFSAQASVAALGLRTVFAVPMGAERVLYLDSQAILTPPATTLHTLARLAELAAEVMSQEVV